MTKEQLEDFLRKNHRPSYLWARQCCGFDDEMAKEVLQNALLKILEGKAVYSGGSNEKTWLFSVIRFTALEQMRKERKHLSINAYQETVIWEDWNEDEADTDFHENMLHRLPDRQRDVLLLVFYHGHSLEETAKVLEISLGSVSTHYDRAKKKLREMLIHEKKTEYGPH